MGRETKIGLALIIILLGAFGFVVYKKLKDQQVDVAQQTESEGDGTDAPPLAGDPDLNEPFATTSPVRPIAHAPAIPDQNEPADPFSSADGDASTAITADMPGRSIPNSEPRQLLDLSDEPTDEPSFRRPIGIARDVADQQQSEFGLTEERTMPAISTGIETTDSVPAESSADETTNSLPALDSPRSTAQPLFVETPRAQSASTQRSMSALPTNRAPAITLSPPEESADLKSGFNEKFDGFEVVAPRRDNAVVTADDERLEGFREVPTEGRRAFAQTRVEKPAPVLASATSGASVAGRPSAASTELTPILPKRGAATAQNDDPFEARPTERIVRKASASPRGTAILHGSNSRTEIAGSEKNPVADVYTIQPNDNFWNISRRQYGTGRYFQALARYNADRVPDPAQMKPGQQIVTPSREVLEQQFSNLIERTANRAASETLSTAAAISDTEQSGFFVDASGQPFYRVGSDDTLTSISQRHLGRASRWTEIYEKNTDQLKTADSLKIGTVLRLPPDASQVRIVQEPATRR